GPTTRARRPGSGPPRTPEDSERASRGAWRLSSSEQAGEEPARRGCLLLLLVVSGAPLARRHGALDLGDVLAAAGPGGLAAGLTGHSSAHGLLLPSRAVCRLVVRIARS